MVEGVDLLQVELEGRDKEGNVFDSTKGEIAKKLHGKEGPLLLSLAHDRIIKGLADALRGMKKGEERELELSPSKAFGSRKKELVKIMSMAEFRKFAVNPESGLLIHVDTDKGRTYGTVKSVSGGRVMVDFNHPLAGQPVTYRVKLVDVLTAPEEKVRALCEHFGVAESWKLEDGKLTLKFKGGSGQDFEMAKSLLLVSLRVKVQGLKEIKVEK